MMPFGCKPRVAIGELQRFDEGARHEERGSVVRATRAPSGNRSYVLYGDPCAYRGAPSEHVDHIVARSRGGANDWTNYAAAYADWNLSKRAKTMLVWLARRRRAC
jgi:HNH endonuclease